jgi:WD40 repeat protein
MFKFTFLLSGLILQFAVETTFAEDREPIRCVGHHGPVEAVALSPDGKLVASSSSDRTTRLWSAVDGKELRRLAVDDPSIEFGGVADVAFLQEGKLLATLLYGQPVRFWDSTSGEEVAKPQSVPAMGGPFGFAFSPDGSKLALAEPNDVRIVGLPEGKDLHTFKFGGWDIGRAWRVAFSPDGRMVAAAEHDVAGRLNTTPKIQVWNAEDGSELFSAANQQGLASASAVAFSPDNKMLAFAVAGDIEIWDIPQKKIAFRFNADERGVSSILYNPTGKTLATAGSESTISFWDAATGKLLAKLKGHSDQINDLSFSADGKTLASAGRDKLILIWPIDSSLR